VISIISFNTTPVSDAMPFGVNYAWFEQYSHKLIQKLVICIIRHVNRNNKNGYVRKNRHGSLNLICWFDSISIITMITYYNLAHTTICKRIS